MPRTEQQKQEKKENKLKRIRQRAKDHFEEYVTKIKEAREISSMRVPLYVFNSRNWANRMWKDSNSPTGYSQKCSYQGICQYPCNGDC